MVAGSHALAGEWTVLCAHKLSACALHAHRIACRSPGGALDPLLGRCWAMVPLDLHLCLINHIHVPRARSGTYIGVRAVGGRVVCEGGAVRGRWSGRNTSCGTVVLQRGFDQTGGPRRQTSRVGPTGSCWYELLLQGWIFSVAKPIFYRGFWKFNLGSRILRFGESRFRNLRSCLCRRVSDQLS